MHSVTYNQDLVSPTLLAGWTKLRDLYELTGNHQVTMTHFERSVFFLAIFKSSSKPKAYPKWHSLYHQVPNSVTFKLLLNVSSIMYSFMKPAGFTHLNLEGITECRIVYNHWRKTAKIRNRWRTFSQSQKLQARTLIIFEFPDATSNFVLFWICL
ncbi:hypothetical protein HKD37_09G025059 [Glycine soja]